MKWFTIILLMCISQNKHIVLPVIQYADTELKRFINDDGMTFV